MDNYHKKLLKDMLTCIENIVNYVGDNPTFAEYENNPLLQDAVEQNLITIGEAMNALLKLSPQLNFANARKIVDTRNKLTHAYDVIENLQIWNIIIQHLPILKLEIKSMLGE